MEFHWIVGYHPGEEPLYEGEQNFIPRKGESLVIPGWPRFIFPVKHIRYNLIANSVFIGVETGYEMAD